MSFQNVSASSTTLTTPVLPGIPKIVSSTSAIPLSFASPPLSCTTPLATSNGIPCPPSVIPPPPRDPLSPNDVIHHCLHLLSLSVQSLSSFFSTSTSLPRPVSPETPTKHIHESPTKESYDVHLPLSSSLPHDHPNFNPKEVIQQIHALLQKLKSVVEVQQERHLEVEKIKNLIVGEYETLSVQLFEQANSLVKEERLLRHTLEQKLKLSQQKEKEANELVDTLQTELDEIKSTVYTQQQESSTLPHAPASSFAGSSLPAFLPSPPPMFTDFVRDLCDPTQSSEIRQKKVMQSKFMETLKLECRATLPLDHFSWYQKSKFLNAVFHHQVAIDQTYTMAGDVPCFTCHAPLRTVSEHDPVFLLRTEEKGLLSSSPTPAMVQGGGGGWRICLGCRSKCVSVCQLLHYLRMQLQSVPHLPLPAPRGRRPSFPSKEPSNLPISDLDPHAILTLEYPMSSDPEADEEETVPWTPASFLVQKCWRKLSELRHQMYLTKLGITQGWSTD